MKLKACPKCNCLKLASLFYVRPKLKDGLSSWCKECDSAQGKRWYAENKEKRQAAIRAYAAANREETLAYRKAWAEANRDKVSAAARKWQKSNPDKQRALEAKRRAAELRAIPPWFDADATAAVYKRARELRDLGLDVHVDHIVPLRGKNVSGLHVHYNLQVLLANDNLKKSNRF